MSDEKKKVVIFIDYDNIYVLLEKYYEKNIADRNSLKTKIIKDIKDKFNNDNILSIKAFADFQRIKTELTDLQKNQVELRHVYSTNQGRKNASDIALSVDVIKSIHSKHFIDKYVIVSSDSDMLPLINELKYFNKEVIVIYSGYGSIDNYEEYIKTDKVNCIQLESLLGITDIYKPISKNDIEKDLAKYVNLINCEINRIANRHNGIGTASKQDIRKILWEKAELVYNDIDEIIKYLLTKKIMFEFFTDNISYIKVSLDENIIKTLQITLRQGIVNYQKLLTKFNKI